MVARSNDVVNKIVEYPHNYERMKDKLAKNFNTKEQEVFANKSYKEVLEEKSAAVKEHRYKSGTDYVKIEDDTVIKNPTSPEVHKEYERVQKEMQQATTVAKEAIDQMPSLETKISLSSRTIEQR